MNDSPSMHLPMPMTRSATDTAFVPVAVIEPPAAVKTGDIGIELRRGPTALTIRWPVSAATDCGARAVALIRVEVAWPKVEPLDLRPGMEPVLNRVVTAFGAARPHHAYLRQLPCEPDQGAGARGNRRVARGPAA